MKFKIGEDCMACGLCFSKCPLQCIYPGDEHYEIDMEKCVTCGVCKSVCPIGAIGDE